MGREMEWKLAVPEAGLLDGIPLTLDRDCCDYSWTLTSLATQMLNNLPAMQEM